MFDKVWTISNSLSFLRLLLVAPIAFLILSRQESLHSLAIGLMVLAVLTDLFDGILARKLNQVTEFGKILDPLADKVAVGTVVVILTLQEKLPLWFVLLVVARDVLILVGGMYVRKTRSVVLQSNLVGKWAVAVISGVILVVVLDIPGLLWLKDSLIILGTIMLMWSFILYSARFTSLVFLNSQLSITDPKS